MALPRGVRWGAAPHPGRGNDSPYTPQLGGNSIMHKEKKAGYACSVGRPFDGSGRRCCSEGSAEGLRWCAAPHLGRGNDSPYTPQYGDIITNDRKRRLAALTVRAGLSLCIFSCCVLLGGSKRQRALLARQRLQRGPAFCYGFMLLKFCPAAANDSRLCRPAADASQLCRRPERTACLFESFKE